MRGGGAKKGMEARRGRKGAMAAYAEQQCVQELLQRGVVGESAGQRHSTSIAKGVPAETEQGERQRGEVAGQKEEMWRMKRRKHEARAAPTRQLPSITH